MGLFGGDDAGFGAARGSQQEIRDQLKLIKDPEYAQLIPELYQNEQLNYDLVQDDPLTKSMQMQSLARLAGLAESGQSDVDAAGFQNAKNIGLQQAHGGTAAAIQDAQNRGVGGSGMEFAMREMANQGGAQMSQNSALAQADSAAKQRALYQQAYGQQVAGARDQNYRANAGNTDIINRFNQANTLNRNTTNMANVDKREDAFKYNEGLKDKNYQNQLGRADRIAGIATRDGEISAAEAEAKRRRDAALMGAVGTGVGAAVGGPVGAGVGGAVGSSL